ATSIMRAGAIREPVVPPAETPLIAVDPPQELQPDVIAPEPGKPARRLKKPLLMAIAVAVMGLVAVLYFALRSTAPSSPAVETGIRFEIDPLGAQISVNGQHCIAPCDLKLKPGNYTVQANHEGYVPIQEKILVGSRSETISLKLSPPRLNRGTMVVETNMDQVGIYVDGALKGVTQGKKATLAVPPGPHKITVEKTGGFTAALQVVDIATDKQSTLQFTLSKTEEASNQPLPDPYLLVTAHPGAIVKVDSKNMGEVPSDGNLSLPAKQGQHRVDLTLNGYEPWSKIVKLKLGDKLPVTADLKAIPKPPPFITTFVASSYDIQPGQPVELRWDIRNAKEVD